MNPLDYINGWKLWPLIPDTSHLFATSCDSKWAKFRIHLVMILRNVSNFFGI